jgi:hypothetical protein
VTQKFIGAPIFGEFDRTASQVAVILFQLRFEAAKKCEGVGSRARESCQDFVVVKAANFFFAVCLMTDSPSVTCPSPARTTLPFRRIDKTVVDRISRFVGMSAIPDYSSAEQQGAERQGKRMERASFNLGDDRGLPRRLRTSRFLPAQR